MSAYEVCTPERTISMGKAYRTIQPSRYEGKITREAVATAVRSLSESRDSKGSVRIKSVAGSDLAVRKGHGHTASTIKKG